MMCFREAMRRGSVLIIAIGLIVLMASLATSFILLVRERLGNGWLTMASQRLHVFTDETNNRLQAMLVDSLAGNDSDGTPKADGITSFAQGWYQDYMSVDDAGNPCWIHQKPSADPELNVSRYEELWDEWGGGMDWTVLPIEPAKTIDAKRFNYGHASWKYMRLLDEDLREVAAPTDGTPHRDVARYALRFATTILDNHGQWNLNPFWPEAPPVVGSGDARFESHLQYQNFLTRTSRAYKAMMGGTGYVQRQRPDLYKSPVWPYDEEYAQAGIAGDRNGDIDQWTSAEGNGRRDARVAYINLFRRTAAQQGRNDSYDNGAYEATAAAGIYTAKMLKQNAFVVDNEIWDDDRWGIFLGRAPGLLGPGTPAVAGGRGVDDCTTQWRINPLTASGQVLMGMICGLTRRTDRGAARLDLLGYDYPEAFPLGVEGGRAIKLIGSGTRTKGYGYDGGNLPGLALSKGWTGMVNMPVGARDSYYADIVGALDQALGAARRVYNEGASLTGVVAVPDIDGNTGSRIDPDATSALAVKNGIIAETLRILGEPKIDTRSFAVPTSVGGILGGHAQMVGMGSNENSVDLYRDRDNYGPWGYFSHGWQGDAPWPGYLAPGSNSRALEYLLNDTMMSLFGWANPTFDPSSDDETKRMVDFNGDGMAESTFTGWWDCSTVNGVIQRRTVFSWWWDGIGPSEAMDTNLDDPNDDNPLPMWMRTGAWYRFDPGQSGTGWTDHVLRFDGSRWVKLSDARYSGAADLFKAANQAYLDIDGWSRSLGIKPGRVRNGPIRPFSMTGRLEPARSKAYTILLRTQLYDFKEQTVIAEENNETVLEIDPDNDGFLDDSHVILHRSFVVTSDQIFE